MASPVTPLDRGDWNDISRRFAYDYNDAGEPSASQGMVRELIITYVNSGRDFREPPGPDGFVLRVTPLEKNYHPVKVNADVIITLFNDAMKEPLSAWFIPRGQLEQHWMPTRMLDCYLFRLDWGLDGLPKGDYRLKVLFIYQQKNITRKICQEIAFQNIL